MNSSIFKIIILLLFSLGASANEPIKNAFYVSPNGSDANDGRLISEGGNGPWLTIQKAASVAQGGDTVYVRQGVYSEPKGLAIASKSPGIEIVNDGFEGNYIRILGYPGERPVVDMGGASACFSIYGRSYIEISNFELRNCSGGGVWIRSGSARGNDHIIIKNNIIHNVDGVKGGNVGGIRADHVTDSVISDNKIYNIRVAGELNQNCSGIHSYQMGNMIIEHNEISDAYNGVFAKHPNFKEIDVGEFRYNIINNVKAAFRFENSEGLPNFAYHKNAKIHHNLVFDGSFIYDNAFRAKTQSHGLDIYNNTIVGSGIKISGFSDVSIYNNIFYNNAYIITQRSDDVDTSSERFGGSLKYVDYNIYYPDFYAVLGQYGSQAVKYGSLTDWQNLNRTKPIVKYALNMNSQPDVHSRVTNPLFSNDNSMDFSLSASSPALNAGRFGGDIGAYDGGSSPGIRTSSGVAPPDAPVLLVE